MISTWAFWSSNSGTPSSLGDNCPYPTCAGTLGTRSVPGRVRGGHPASLRPLPLAANSGFRPGRDGRRRGQEARLRWPGGTPGPLEDTRASVAAGGVRAGGAAALLPLWRRRLRTFRRSRHGLVWLSPPSRRPPSSAPPRASQKRAVGTPLASPGA